MVIIVHSFSFPADNPEMFGLIYFSSAQNKDTLTTYKLIGGANKEQWIKEIVKCLSETKCTADSVRKFSYVTLFVEIFARLPGLTRYALTLSSMGSNPTNFYGGRGRAICPLPKISET